MNAEFLPKSLDGIGNRKYIIDHQTYTLRTKMHWHDCIEIVFVEKGSVKMFFNNEWCELLEGEMIFIPPQQIHFTHADNDKSVRTVIGINKNLICDEDAYAENIFFPFESNKINQHCFFKDNGELSKIFENLHLLEDSPVGSLLIQSEILKIYAYIYKEWLKKDLSIIEPIKDKTIYNLVNVLKNDYATAPSAAEMADKLNISYSHMCRILNNKLGTSYKTLLNSIRIENAKKMLLSTDKNITEIGFDCGFTDSSYFIKMFGKSVGTTPNKYRELRKVTM